MHPGANHYWIHLMESSAHPEQAQASAERLRRLVPGSGHLRTCRPTSTCARAATPKRSRPTSGRSRRTSATSEQVDAQGAYRVGYVAHNRHFLWAAAAMDGRSATALAAARDAFPSACGPGRNDRSTGILQHYYVLPLFALVRFGRWREILEDTLPPDVDEPYPRAIWHYARGTAYAKTGRIAEARREQDALARFAADPALQRARIKNINPAEALVRIATLTLAADIATAEKRMDIAVAKLVEATAVEDALAYDEPHLWLAPTRHALGAALLAAGRLPTRNASIAKTCGTTPKTDGRSSASPRRSAVRDRRRRRARPSAGSGSRGATPTSRCRARASRFAEVHGPPARTRGRR